MIYVYMYMCIYLYMYICIYAYTYICIIIRIIYFGRLMAIEVIGDLPPQLLVNAVEDTAKKLLRVLVALSIFNI